MCRDKTDKNGLKSVAAIFSPHAYLLKLSDLVVQVVHTPLVLQGELGEQVCPQLGLQGLPGGLHGVQAGLQTLETALLPGDIARGERVREQLTGWDFNHG